jgi:hypothetical protein
MVMTDKDILPKAQKEIIRVQIERLHQIYEMYFNREDTRQLVNFFFDKIYAMDNNDKFLKIAIDTFSKVKFTLNPTTRENLETIIRVHEFTTELDGGMGKLLVEKGWYGDKKISIKEYLEIYCEFGRGKDRLDQLKTVIKCMRIFYAMAHRPQAEAYLKAAKLFSKIFNVHSLFMQLESGYHATVSVKPDVFEAFVKEVEATEADFIMNEFPEVTKY